MFVSSRRPGLPNRANGKKVSIEMDFVAQIWVAESSCSFTLKAHLLCHLLHSMAKCIEHYNQDENEESGK